MLIKVFSAFLVIFLLEGCATYIAHEITSSSGLNFSGALSSLYSSQDICDDQKNCVLVTTIKKRPLKDLNLSFEFKLGDNYKVWSYKLKETSVATVKPLNNQLIFIFAGYSQPIEVMTLHQIWLQHITGAKVFIIHSPEHSEKFKFGLDYVSPITAEINRLKPEKTHLIGISMGAVAAQAVAERVTNAELHLIAPMTNFSQSLKAIWKKDYSKKFYAQLISTETIQKASDIIFQDSETSPEEIDIVRKIQKTKINSYIYTSTEDKVSPASDWTSIKNEYIKINKYEELTHMEMVSFSNQGLLLDFVSNLLKREVSMYDTEIIGVMCDSDDDICLNKV